MKNIKIFIICTLFIQACAASGAGNVPPTPIPFLASTSTEIPSATATVPTPTYTSTPTLIALQKTDTSTSDVTVIQTQETPLLLLTPNTSTPAPQMKGFLAINVSAKEFYKGGECQPTSVKFSAQVTDVVNTSYVLLFIRYKSKKTGATGDWANSIAMESIGAGTFIHDLVVTETKNVENFKNPWVEYQFVATNSKGREIGRTDTFSERLTLLECVPTPTAEVSATPTLPKP